MYVFMRMRVCLSIIAIPDFFKMCGFATIL